MTEDKMWWLSVIMLVSMVTAFVKLRTEADHPLGPWRWAGEFPRAWVVNTTTDSLPVYALASEVDSLTRFMGMAPPADSVLLRIPYGDTRVTLVTPRGYTTFVVDRPREYRWEIP